MLFEKVIWVIRLILRKPLFLLQVLAVEILHNHYDTDRTGTQILTIKPQPLTL